jgi:hypothetical protein
MDHNKQFEDECTCQANISHDADIEYQLIVRRTQVQLVSSVDQTSQAAAVQQF